MTLNDGRLFDADNHYYEAIDAFTRHIPKGMEKRCMQWVEMNGKQRLLVGGKLNRFIPNPTFDPVARPGSLDEYFRGRNPEAKDMKAAFGALEPINPGYRDRDARLKIMDEQGIGGTVLYPTLGVGMEVSLQHDPEAVVAAFQAFNRWVEDDWGYAYQDRIFAAAYITLVDVDEAVKEVERVLALDCRVVNIKGGPVFAGDMAWSPGDQRFDPVWARLAESGVMVGIHSGDAGYGKYLSDWENPKDFEAFRATPLQSMISSDRVPFDTYAALLAHGVFDRFPNLRVCSIESGSEWVPLLVKKLKKVYGQNPTAFGRDPIESFVEHVWVAPFYEDDMGKLKDLIGVDRILFGSDWPHAEGLFDPKTFADDLRKWDYSDDEIRQIMVDNGWTLPERRPALVSA
jgi:predicted TIM-barrel fold metal-dependent hydrolase